jgi:hypothetical protein|tara:strand:+ start:5542 stop:5778 length:237 start_codon:yes stop_codon:yes gene_type:complete
MGSKRKNQINTWVDKDFKQFLEKVRAKKILAGEDVKNLGQITGEMMRTEAIKELERQLLKNQKKDLIKLKMDQRRGIF